MPLVLLSCRPAPQPSLGDLANSEPAAAGCPKKEVAPDCAPEFPFGNEGKKLYVPDIRYVWLGSIQYSKPDRIVSSPFFGFDWRTLEPLEANRESYPLSRGAPSAVSFQMHARWTTEAFMPPVDRTLGHLENMHPSERIPPITPPEGFVYFEENRELPARDSAYNKDFEFIKVPTKDSPGEVLGCTWIFKDSKGPFDRVKCKASFTVSGDIQVDASFNAADKANIPYAAVRNATAALIDRWRSPPIGAKPTPARLPPSESTAGIQRWRKPVSTFQKKSQIAEFPFGQNGGRLYVPLHDKHNSLRVDETRNVSFLSASFDLDTLAPHEWPNASEEAKNMLSLFLQARLGESEEPLKGLSYYTLKYLRPSKAVPGVLPPEGFTYYEDAYYRPPGMNRRQFVFHKPASGNEPGVALRCEVSLKLADGTPKTTPSQCMAEFVVPEGIYVKAFFPVEGGNSQSAYTKAYAGAHTLLARWRVTP